MKDFLFEIKTRFGKSFPLTLWALLKLYYQIITRKDFYSDKDARKIDVVIPTTDKDFETLSVVINSLKNVGNKINKIYIVAPAKERLIKFCNERNIIFFDELKVLGFGKDSLVDYTVCGIDRRGWLFQQFLKYGMKDFTEQEDYLVLDSDTVLTNTNTFIENGEFIFYKNTEWHKAYFEVFVEIFGYETKSYTSFTSHMMIFNKKYLNEMLSEIEEKNKDRWYNVIQKKINRKESSSVSDYENYGQWMFIRHNDLIVEKPLYNRGLKRNFLDNLEALESRYSKKYKTLSFHDWIKK